MGFWHELRKHSLRLVGPFLALAAIGYFVYHAVHGQRGLLAWWAIQNEIGKAEEAAGQIAEERRRWEVRVSLLSAETLDPDLLEERARIVLGHSLPDDILVPVPPSR